MTEYKLKVKDNTDPKSRLVFLKRLEEFLGELRNDEVIESYILSTPYSSIALFKVEAEV